MPRKRKSQAPADETPKITITEAQPIEIPQAVRVPIRCIWDSRLIVGADKTPSGTRYEFNTGETKPVNELDYEYLLSLETKTPGCCGGYGGSSSIGRQKYFEAVEV